MCRGTRPEQGEDGKDSGHQSKDQSGGIIAAAHKKAVRACQSQTKPKERAPALPPLQTELAEDHAHAEAPEHQVVGSAVLPEDTLCRGGEILHAQQGDDAAQQHRPGPALCVQGAKG